MHAAAGVRAGLLARLVRRHPGLGRQLSQNVAAVLQSSPVTTWGGRSDARTQAAHLTPVAAAVLETSGKAAATIEASGGPPAVHASGAPRANGATQSNANGVTRSAATPLTRSVAYAWLKERKAKQEAAIIEATVLLQGDATGDAAAASLNAAMMSCGDIGRWAQALALYERMAAGGVRVEQRSFRLAMTSAMQLGRYETALHIWHRLLAAGLRPQREEYTVSMSACERLGEWEEALGLFDEMAAGATPDTNTLHVAILACERGGQASRADGLLRRMEAFGRPPTALYNAAMRACARHGNAHAGTLDALTRMRRLGMPRDAATYRAALAACQVGGAPARSDMLSVVNWLLQEPEAVVRTRTHCPSPSPSPSASASASASPDLSPGPNPNPNPNPLQVRACTGDAPLCTSALEACAASGHWRAALALLRHARPAAASVRPGAFLPAGTSFCGVPAGTTICGRGERERAAEAAAAVRPPPDSPAAAAWAVETLQWYELALRACAARGQWSCAMQLLESLRELEVPLSAACYTHAISACSNGAQWHEVLVLYGEPRGSTPTPTPTPTPKPNLDPNPNPDPDPDPYQVSCAAMRHMSTRPLREWRSCAAWARSRTTRPSSRSVASSAAPMRSHSSRSFPRCTPPLCTPPLCICIPPLCICTPPRLPPQPPQPCMGSTWRRHRRPCLTMGAGSSRWRRPRRRWRRRRRRRRRRRKRWRWRRTRRRLRASDARRRRSTLRSSRA